MGPRTIADHLIYFLETGALDARVDGKAFQIETNRLFWTRPGVPQHFRIGDSGGATIHFLRFSLPLDPITDESVTHRLFGKSPALRALMQALLPEHSPSGELEIPYLRCQLGALFARLLSNPDGPGSEARGLLPYQKNLALGYLQQHLSRRFSLGDVADSVGLHPDYFSRQFRKSFGVPFQEYVKQERIRLACGYLLESGLSITEISRKLGYEDIYFFSRQFKQVTGESPKQWRSKAS